MLNHVQTNGPPCGRIDLRWTLRFMPQRIPSDHSLTKLDVFDILRQQLNVSVFGTRQDSGRRQAQNPGHDRVDLSCDSSTESVVKTQGGLVIADFKVHVDKRSWQDPFRRINIRQSPGIPKARCLSTHHDCRRLIIQNDPLSRFQTRATHAETHWLSLATSDQNCSHHPSRSQQCDVENEIYRRMLRAWAYMTIIPDR